MNEYIYIYIYIYIYEMLQQKTDTTDSVDVYTSGNQGMQSMMQANCQGREEKWKPDSALLENYLPLPLFVNVMGSNFMWENTLLPTGPISNLIPISIWPDVSHHISKTIVTIVNAINYERK